MLSSVTHEATAKTRDVLISAGHKIHEGASHANEYTKEVFIHAGQKIQASAEATTSKAKEVLTEAVSKMKKAFIGSNSEAPVFILDNEYITTGYRIDHHTCWRASKSLFTCHNETVNVWTHFLGSLVFLICFIAVAAVIAPTRFELGQTLVKSDVSPNNLVAFMNTEISNLQIATRALNLNSSTFETE